jgi:hypothetical protein
MRDIKLITKAELRLSKEASFNRGEKLKVVNPVQLRNSTISSRGVSTLSKAEESNINSSVSLSNDSILLSGAYASGYEAPIFENGTMSWNDKIRDGKVDLKSTNNLNENWTDYMDATRLDLTIRKEAKPTVRESIYDVVVNPAFTKDVRPTELNPYGVAFTENNGTGESVKQGENRSGQDTTVPMKIYSAGFTWTLLAELFDGSYNQGLLNDGVAVGYSAKQDDNAIAPILAASYSGAQLTAASTDGSNRQEKLYNTLSNAVDDLAKRKDPVTKRNLSNGDMVVLASEYDAAHIEFVLQGGLPSTNERKHPGIPSITTVVGYDGEIITLENETITYPGVTDGTVYLIKRSRYLKIAQKLGLTVETDQNPDVATLAREQRAYYFVEALYNSVGIASFIQKVTLPTW